MPRFSKQLSPQRRQKRTHSDWLGRDFTGTTSDAVVFVAVPVRDAAPAHTYAGTYTEPGRRIYDAVLHGVMASLDRQENRIARSRPSHFIYSRYGGAHWVEWQKKTARTIPAIFRDRHATSATARSTPATTRSWETSLTARPAGNIWGHAQAACSFTSRRPQHTSKPITTQHSTS